MRTTCKLLCLALAIMMMLPMIASCNLFGKKDAETTVTTSDDAAATPKDEIYTMTGLEEKTFEDELYVVGYSFGGGTYISEWIPKPLNVSILDTKSDIVAEASYKRDSRFESLTGARLSYQGYATNPNTHSGAYSESAKFLDLHSGGLLKDYDLLMFGATTAGKLIQEKVLMDLNEYDNLVHHDADYYTSTINADLSMAGKQFATAGYYTTGNIRGTQITMVNNTLLTNQHGENIISELYDLAINKQWTLEKLLSYDAGFATGTINGDESDKYTLVISQYGVEELFYAMGGQLITKNSQDLPVVVINSAENQARLSKIQSITRDTTKVHVPRESGSGAMFIKGQSLFQIAMLGAYGAARRTGDYDECLMPIPLEKEGGEYKSHIPTWNANVSGIPAQTADAETSAYLYEMYMALSYSYIYPAFYEKTMKLTYVNNETEAKIFDEIAKTVCLDIAAVYTWINAENTDIRQMNDNKAEITATVTNMASVMQNKIDEFLGNYEID